MRPSLAYVGAERLGGSGVLAVLALGLFLRTYGHAATTSQGWLLGRAVWSYADFLITSLVFAILGYELVRVIGATDVTRHAVALSGVVVATSSSASARCGCSPARRWLVVGRGVAMCRGPAAGVSPRSSPGPECVEW